VAGISLRMLHQKIEIVLEIETLDAERTEVLLEMCEIYEKEETA
jgi:hypothetical protein